MKSIIAIIGPIASGKDTLAEYLSSKYGAPVFQVSQVLKDIAAEQDLEPTRENLMHIGDELTREHGPAALPKMLLDRLGDRTIVTGIRRPEVLAYLRKNSSVFVISINADPNLRFQRAKDRGKIGESETSEDFIRKDNFTVLEADAFIENDGTIEDLILSANTLLGRISF